MNPPTEIEIQCALDRLKAIHADAVAGKLKGKTSREISDLVRADVEILTRACDGSEDGIQRAREIVRRLGEVPEVPEPTATSTSQEEEIAVAW